MATGYTHDARPGGFVDLENVRGPGTEEGGVMAVDVVDILSRAGADLAAVEGTAAHELALAQQAFEELLSLADDCTGGTATLSKLRSMVDDLRAAQRRTDLKWLRQRRVR